MSLSSHSHSREQQDPSKARIPSRDFQAKSGALSICVNTGPGFLADKNRDLREDVLLPAIQLGMPGNTPLGLALLDSSFLF